tara:strand:- start:1939 stop:3354 length:1416 start_codon:yes stop_codon:yes gene_type:complete
MNRLFAFLFFFFLGNCITAQQIQYYPSFYSFWDEELDLSYLELSIAFDVNTLKLIKESNFFYSEIDIITEIKQQDSIYYYDHYVCKSPSFSKSENNNIFFFDTQNFYLPNGEYDFLISVFDRNNSGDTINYFDTKKINYEFNDKIYLSDLKLITLNETLVRDDISNITPFVSNYFPQNINSLSFYFQVYNTENFINNKYLLRTYIESFSSKKSLFNYDKVRRKIIEQDSSSNFIFSFDIDKLPTGNYNLVCELIDEQNNLIDFKKTFFQRSNSVSSYSNNDIDIISVGGTFVENITEKDVLSLYIDYLYPICSPSENIFAQNQLKDRNISLMQKFFLNFWKSRNPLSPEETWLKYYQKVKSVNNDFTNFKIPGYLTDRGRVYLQYGPPNTIHSVENASSSYPYEIWHYYKLKNQSDRKFVFVNTDFATNEYRLEYSNVFGEVTNSEWWDKIEQSNSPTFGDDFNNNYINPR